jgi:hypothetical protein
MKLGTLEVRGCPVKIPKNPKCGGDTFGCNSPEIGFTDTKEGFEIQWLPLDRKQFNLQKDRDIYICDRNILTGISWDALEKAGYVDGKQMCIDGKNCIIRLMTGSDGTDGEYGPKYNSEWDMMMDQYNEQDSITHWKDMYSWCKEQYENYLSRRLLRGFLSARNCENTYATNSLLDVGFRPVLEVLNTDI